jgi:hypothetical protein
MTTTRPPPVFEMLPGDYLHIYLGRDDAICVLQGSVDIGCDHWLAERVVLLVQRLDTDTHYQPVDAGWVQLRALPGEAARLQRVNSSVRTPLGNAFRRVLQFLGFASLTLKAAP